MTKHRELIATLTVAGVFALIIVVWLVNIQQVRDWLTGLGG